MLYQLTQPQIRKVPIVVSVPHCGIDFPDEVRSAYHPDALSSLDDTDWFVDKLYDFVTEMGITMISANYHRWLIDLNRNAESKPLYDDGRVITGLTSLTDFNGQAIYNEGSEPTPEEIDRRLNEYYNPYYNQIAQLLGDLKKQFKHVLLFDAHSIRQFVPGVHPEKFPDLILGDVDGTSANTDIINSAEQALCDPNYSFAHNFPFKGGNITRHFGKPAQNCHAIQLEMSKLVYMNDQETKYDPSRAEKIREVLKNMFTDLITTLNHMNK